MEKAMDTWETEIEKRDKLINDLTLLYNQSLEYDRQKTNFFANIAHELKTPLSVILGAIQLIEARRQTAVRSDAFLNKNFNVIKQNCQRLLHLADNMLDLAKADCGHMGINPENVDMVDMVDGIIQSVMPLSEEKKIKIRFHYTEKEITTAVDTEKMERILLNLLSNAIKYTGPGGEIDIAVKKNDKNVQISVKDNGPGIPSGMQNVIFERFRRLDCVPTELNRGSGIGLSLVKSFVELHDGSVKVISEEKKGSEFIVEIPLRICKRNSFTGNGRMVTDPVREA